MWPFKVRVGVTQGQSKTEIPLYIQVHVYMHLSVSFKRGANFFFTFFFVKSLQLFNLYFYTAD